MLHLIVGKWRTPNHSNEKSEDDSHKVKRTILKQIGKRMYSKAVGNNPDIDINSEGVIILKGTGERKRSYYVSDIPASDHFVLHFVKSEEYIEVQVLIIDFENASDDFEDLIIIPFDENLILFLFDLLIEDFIKQTELESKNILVLTPKQMYL